MREMYWSKPEHTFSSSRRMDANQRLVEQQPVCHLLYEMLLLFAAPPLKSCYRSVLPDIVGSDVVASRLA